MSWINAKIITDTGETELSELTELGLSYFFARRIGMVGLSCWTDAPDHFSCGNEYIGASK